MNMKEPMNTTKTELLEEFRKEFINDNSPDYEDSFIDANGDGGRAVIFFSEALDRYRDSVVEEAYKNGFKDGMNNRERTSKKIFNIVSKYQTHHGYPPTLKEIKDACGAKSITTVQRALVNLKKMGLISQNKYQKRAWYIPTIPMVLREQTNNNTTKGNDE